MSVRILKTICNSYTSITGENRYGYHHRNKLERCADWYCRGDDILMGEARDDFIHGGSGNDAVQGGNDEDIILASQDVIANF